MDVDAVTLVIIVFVVALTTFVFSVLGKYCGEKFLGNPKRRQRPRSSRIPKCYQCSYGGREYPSKRFRRRSNDGGVSFAVHRPSASPEEIRLNTMRPAAGAEAAPAHCSKSSFFVQKFNFENCRFSGGVKLVKMLWFWTF